MSKEQEEKIEEDLKEEAKSEAANEGTPIEETSTLEKPEEQETQPAADKKKADEEEEIEVVEEKFYTIPLRHVWTVTPRGRRAPRAVRDVKAFISRHMKAEEVAISNDINSAIWSRSINKPPRKIRVRAVKDKEGKVIVYTA